MSNFKPLKRSSLILFHRRQGKIVKGANEKMTCFSGLRGDCTGLRGDCTGLWGDCTGLRGDIHVFVQE